MRSNIWISSDFHIAHSNIAGPSVSTWKSGYRDFKSVFDMNETIFAGINDNVKQDDILYFLGDFCFSDHRKTPEYRNRIICKNIHFIRGNHDNHIDKYRGSFNSIQDVLTITAMNRTIFMSHYAHRVWYGSHKGIIHCYGHSHNSIPDYGKSMDVGIDSAKFLLEEWRPFNLEEIVSIMDKREIIYPDHHDSQTNVR